MGVFANNGLTPPPPSDPRLAPTPDFGTLGPGSDFAKSSAGPKQNVPPGATKPQPGNQNLRLLHLLAVAGGVIAALLVSSGGTSWKKFNTSPSSIKHAAGSSSIGSKDRAVDSEKPQKQAEMLLTRAVSQSAGATDEIESHVDSWRGKLTWNSQLSQLTTVALNSTNQEVRASGIEVQLAAYGLSKDNATVDTLILQANSSNQPQKIWALWALGLMGNRGVETDHVVQILTGQLKNPKNSEEGRHWAVEGLALVGTSSTIPILLDTMHNDRSPLVRERAACSLAESGMLTHEQRLTAVPQLINYTDDPALDAQTHAWAFQALHDITKQPLPNNSTAWRSWFESSAGGQ